MAPYKFQMGEVLNEAFQFGMARWASVIRFSWLPFLIGMLILGGAIASIFDINALRAIEEDGPVDLNSIFRVSWGMAFLLFFLGVTAFLYFFSGAMASIYRLVALGEERPGIFQLRLDGPAHRTFFAYMIMTLLGNLIMILSFFVATAVTGTSPAEMAGTLRGLFQAVVEAESQGVQPDPSVFEPMLNIAGAIFLTFVIALIPTIYLNVKLSPFAAGSAAENRLFFIGALNLTKGSFWAILGTLTVLFGALWLLAIVFQLAAGILDMIAQLVGGQGGGLIAGILSLVIFVATVVYQAFVYAVQLGVQGIIYRRLKTGA